jgi:3-dehydrosphinganine reductase
MQTFSNKKILITGGSSGIGLALASQLAEQGASVWILARKEQQLKQALKIIESHRNSSLQLFGTIQADVANLETLKPVLNNFVAENGAPDVLINSAGVAHPGEFIDIEMDIFHWMMDVNYFGTVNVIHLVLPAMLERGQGKIINFSSMAGYLGVYGYTAYGASKFAVRGFSDALRAELKPKGITVSIVFPPDTDTPQLAYEEPFKPPVTHFLSGNAKIMSPEAVASITLRQAARNRYIITPGFESTLFFTISNLLGKGIYRIMDIQVSQALMRFSFLDK